MTPGELTGQLRTHLVELAQPACTLHLDVVAPLLNLRRAALAAGFDLQPVSSFRDFNRQLAIWNAKFSGARPMLDALGRPIDCEALSAAERVESILIWSALPGASRHHWGTDVDLIDHRAVAPGYAVRLTADEFARGGPFAAFGEWLNDNAERFGFFRPYCGRRSAVAAEPWHWSFAPVAEFARLELTPAMLYTALAAAELLGKEQVMVRIEELHARFVAAIDWP